MKKEEETKNQTPKHTTQQEKINIGLNKTLKVWCIFIYLRKLRILSCSFAPIAAFQRSSSINQVFFFLPQYCQSSLQSSVQIHTQPKLFSNQIQHFIQKLKANVVKNKKKIQRFFDNGFPHKPKFPFNELFLNVSNCFPCGIYLFDKYFPCGIKPMRLL